MSEEQNQEISEKKYLLDRRISYSAIKRYENCPAGYLFTYDILPRIRTKDMEKISSFGSIFHEVAEHEFSKEKIAEGAASLSTDKEERELEACIKKAKGRDYYKLPSERELELEMPVSDIGIFHGILDRVATDAPTVYLIDFKTTAMPDPFSDLEQMLHYALLLWRVRAVDPENIVIVLDYPRVDSEPRTFHVTKSQLLAVENRLRSNMRKIARLIETYRKYKDLKRITHMPGDCSFCPMKGRCSAYHIHISPLADPGDPEAMDTTSVVRELLELDQYSKLVDARVKALKEAVRIRSEIVTEEIGDTEGRSPREIIEEYYSIIPSSTIEYPAARVIEIYLRQKVSKAIKGAGLTGMVDEQVLVEIAKEILAPVTPTRMTASSLPPGIDPKIKKLGIPRNQTPRLKPR